MATNRFANTTTNRFGGDDLDTSTGLYKTAVDYGLQREADNIIKQHAGEETKDIFSGGFISDIFDVLNAAQYGVTGVLKGKSFAEGVKTRQSFSDDDALGDNGIPGMIAGLALDIAVDPFTYIAPWTIFKHIPGAVKGTQIAKKVVFGERVAKLGKAEEALKLTRLQETREGGTKVGKYLAEKFAFRFGKDPVYQHLAERTSKNIGVATTELVERIDKIAKFKPETAKKLITRTADGTIKRVKFNELQKLLTPEELDSVKQAWTKLDDYGKQAVDLGLISKIKFEENFGEYLKNSFSIFEKEKKKGMFGTARQKILGTQTRKTPEEFATGYLKSLELDEATKLFPKAFDNGKLNLKNLSTDEINKISSKAKESLGQIDNPAYLLFDSTQRLINDVENAKFFNAINKQFGSEVAGEGMVQLGKAKRFSTTAGARAEIFSNIKNINKDIKPLLGKLKSTFKADKKTMSLIKSIEKQLNTLPTKQADEFTKFFQEGGIEKVVSKEGRIIGGAAKLPENLQGIGRTIEKEKGKISGKISKETNLKIEKLFENGDLGRAGFKTVNDFIKFIEEPFKKVGGKERTQLIQGNIDKVIKLQKTIENLTRKATTLKQIDKKSINDAMRTWEKNINDLRFDKEGLVGKVEDLKLSELGGKYIPEDVHKMLTEIIKPDPATFGKKAIAGFKYSKVILNPSTHARNIMSNSLLNWWKLGIGMWRVDLYTEAIRNATKGGKWVDELKKAKVGYNIDTFAHNELGHTMDVAEQFGTGTKALITKVKKKLGDIYQAEENVAKLAAYIHHRKKGIGIEEAWKAAESATFNYAQVTPFVRKLRTAAWGMPFITFGLKAAPVAVETALKHPRRISVIGKIKNNIENLSDIDETDRERASEAPWIKDGFYIKLPQKDKEGRSMYFDLTYIIPFGDLVSGQFVERQINRETGLKEGLPAAAASKFPLFNTIKELTRNQDFSGRKIWRDSDDTKKQGADILRHLTKAYMPPLVADQIPGGYNSSGERVSSGLAKVLTDDQKASQKRTLTQEMLKQVGMKIQPIDVDIQESMKEWNLKKGFKTLLQDRNIVKDFSTSYIPKDSTNRF